MESYKIDYFLLAPEWKEDGIDSSRISFCITGGKDIEEHNVFVKNEIERLEKENDGNYTSWRFTAKKTKEFYGALKFASVIHFRIRDAW